MLGESLLVAPVFTREGDVDYYLPAGTWTGLLDNRTVEGGRWLHEVHDFMSLPLMVRENTLLPIGADDQNVEYDYGKDLTLHVFQLKTKAYTDIKDQNGDDLLQVSAENQNGTLTFHFEGKAENLKLLLRNISSVKEVSGAAAEQTGEGVLLAVNPELRNVTVRL